MNRGIFYVLLCGGKGQAYYLGDTQSDIKLKELAEIVAKHTGRKGVFQLSDESENKGYPAATKALLNYHET